MKSWFYSFKWLIIFSGCISCAAQKRTSQSQLNTNEACKRNWKYANLRDTISGTIMFYEQPIVMCGVVATASVALVKTRSGKVIRVLSLCDIKKDFQTPNRFAAGDSVIVGPQQKPNFRIDLLPLDPKACALSYAFFGNILKAN